MRSVCAWLGFAIVLVIPSALPAGQATKRFEMTAGSKTIQVAVEVDNVRVNQVVLDIENTSGRGPIRRSGSDAEVRMDNNSSKDVEAGVALVLMDAAGNVVGSGSCGTKVGWLKAGERDTCTASFPYVFRNLKNARTLLVTLETRDRPTKK